MGSINNNLSGGSYIYRTTKAAMNCISKNLFIDLKNDIERNISLENTLDSYLKNEVKKSIIRYLNLFSVI